MQACIHYFMIYMEALCSTLLLENKWDQSGVVYATSKQSIASILPNETSDFGRYV